METPSQKLETWALVELFGHQKIVGLVTEATIAGGAFIRVDVPACAPDPAFTRFFGPSAIYSLNPITEELARKLIAGIRNVPVSRFDLPALPAPEPDHGMRTHADDEDDGTF